MPQRVLLVVPDLFFSTRIVSTAKQLGLAVDETGADHALEVARAAAPDLVIVDLHGAGDVIAMVTALKAEARGCRVIAFCRHTATELIRCAREAGADQVLPRSAFFPNLAKILEEGGIGTPE